MKRMGKQWLLSIVAASSMLAAIGCEAVGGVDVNDAVASMMDVQSSVGEMTLEWALTPDTGTLADEETRRLLAAFGTGTLVITEMLQEDRQTASLEGWIELNKGSIPFVLYITGDTLVLDVEGAKSPFQLELSALGAEASLGLSGGGQLNDMLKGEAGQAAIRAIVSYFLAHVPNPDKTSFGQVNETIAGESKLLTKVSVEVGAEEMIGLAAESLESIIADEEGFRAMIGVLYDALKPALEAMVEESPDFALQLALQNKELAVNFIYAQLVPVLEGLAADMATMAMSSDSRMSDDSGLAIDLLMDGLQPAGMDLGLYLEPASEDNDGIKSIAVDLSSRWWNVNGDVAAATFDGAATAPLTFNVKPRDRLSNIEESSILYDILKNDLRMTRHSFDMYMGTNASVPDGVSPYIKGVGTTMVPVRYVSEQLDAAVSWDGTTSTITISDAAEGTTIVMKIGDKTALVNGMEQELPESPELVYNATFVPIAFITKALGGVPAWNGDAGIVTITKEF